MSSCRLPIVSEHSEVAVAEAREARWAVHTDDND
jgi:hypothetical protein